MSKTLIWMLILECSRRPLKLIGEIMEINIINLFGFIIIDNIFEWGENFVQNHPNCTFEELE
jgi:hypothetical protein